MIARRVQLAVLALLVALAACGPDARQRTLKSTISGLDTARHAFIALDQASQAVIVETSSSLEEGQRRLGEYRARRQRVVDAFEVAYRAVALASLDADVNIVEVIAAANALYIAVERFRKGE